MQCVYLVLFTCSAHCKYHIITHTVQCVSRHQLLEYQSATREIQQTLPTNSPRDTTGSNVGTKRGNSVKISKHFNEKTTFLMTWLSVWEQLTLASTAPSLTSALIRVTGYDRKEGNYLLISKTMLNIVLKLEVWFPVGCCCVYSVDSRVGSEAGGEEGETGRSTRSRTLSGVTCRDSDPLHVRSKSEDWLCQRYWTNQVTESNVTPVKVLNCCVQSWGVCELDL